MPSPHSPDTSTTVPPPDPVPSPHVTWSVNSLRHLIGERPYPSAAFIRLLERLGWVHDVRRPTADRVAARRV